MVVVPDSALRDWRGTRARYESDHLPRSRACVRRLRHAASFQTRPCSPLLCSFHALISMQTLPEVQNELVLGRQPEFLPPGRPGFRCSFTVRWRAFHLPSCLRQLSRVRPDAALAGRRGDAGIDKRDIVARSKNWGAAGVIFKWVVRWVLQMTPRVSRLVLARSVLPCRQTVHLQLHSWRCRFAASFRECAHNQDGAVHSSYVRKVHSKSVTRCDAVDSSIPTQQGRVQAVPFVQVQALAWARGALNKPA